mmetsp:Transcript_5037/g.10357  ORF Transcript_5037/g.10357 Transcript_5037/m.10357 type:complete len:88 (-) Transcript_5037:181-444(-)
MICCGRGYFFFCLRHRACSLESQLVTPKVTCSGIGPMKPTAVESVWRERPVWQMNYPAASFSTTSSSISLESRGYRLRNKDERANRW